MLPALATEVAVAHPRQPIVSETNHQLQAGILSVAEITMTRSPDGKGLVDTDRHPQHHSEATSTISVSRDTNLDELILPPLHPETPSHPASRDPRLEDVREQQRMITISAE